MPNRGYSKYQNAIVIVGDMLLLLIAFMTAFYLRIHQPFVFQSADYVVIFLVYIFSWWLIAGQNSLVSTKRGITIESILTRTLRNTAIHLVVIYFAMLLFRFYGVSRLLLFLAIAFEVVLLIGWRILFYQLLMAYRRAGYNYRHIAIIGSNNRAVELYKTITKNPILGFKFYGFFTDETQPALIKKCPVYPLHEFEKWATPNTVDEVYCALDREYETRIKEIIQYCEHNLIRFKLVPSFQQYIKKKVTIEFIEGIPVVLMRQEPLESHFARIVKRLFDIVFSFVVIVLILSWLIPIMGILIKLESKGPIFFTQKRTGKDNVEFNIIKFRSMTVNKDADHKQATKHDARLTKMGRFMRKTNIDEMPQFINVFLGDMSVVGPRPHMVSHTQQYSELINQYMVRHFVKPGITGWAQVNGLRGETYTHDLMRQRVEHDVWYLENWSFMLDISIVFRTVINVFKGEKMAY